MRKGQPIKIIIADVQDVVIDGLLALLQAEEDLQVVGWANNGKQLLEIITNKPVDLVILSIEAMEMNGLEASGKLKHQFPDLKILILTMNNTPGFIANLLRHGADGYILKNTIRKDLVAAIRSVM